MLILTPYSYLTYFMSLIYCRICPQSKLSLNLLLLQILRQNQAGMAQTGGLVTSEDSGAPAQTSAGPECLALFKLLKERRHQPEQNRLKCDPSPEPAQNTPSTVLCCG